MTEQRSFDSIRQRLEAERTALQDEIAALVIENQNQEEDYGVGNHLADDASELFTRERNLAVRNNAQDLLAQVETALRRVDDGSYGICANCNQPINPERLEALPYATLCITCQSQRERGR